jgi:hypothetical protein
MSNVVKRGIALSTAVAITLGGWTSPASAARIKNLDCESRLSRINCHVTFEYTGLVDFYWYANGRLQPLFPEPYFSTSCVPGRSYTIKVKMVDDAGTDTESVPVICRSGNP